MHNIDRTVREAGNPAGFELDEFNQEWGGEFEEEFESFNGEQYESQLTELQELELATELLTVTNEAELDQFLGKMAKKGGGGGFLKKAWNSPIGNLLRKGLKFVAPIAGKVVGGMFGGPVGAQLGSKLASGAVKLFRLELEGLSAEDQEFEVARAYVRYANEVAHQAGLNAKHGASPKQAVQAAMTEAARRHAPGLLEASNEIFEMSAGGALGAAAGSRYASGSFGGGLPHSGRWFRKGRRIYIQVAP